MPPLSRDAPSISDPVGSQIGSVKRAALSRTIYSPHQALDMATPADVFRPAPETPERKADVVLPPQAPEAQPAPLPLQVPAGLPTQRAPIHEDEIRAVEFTAVISLGGRLCLPGGS